MKCDSMVSIAALCPGDQIHINIEFTRIIQAYDQATQILSTVTVSSFVGINK